MTDHPRACGEHSFEHLCRAVSLGSSPRLRGTPGACRPDDRHPGIIPALAGNTCVKSVWKHRRRDHPRACGEHARRGQQSGLDEGSSPRLRGTRVVVSANEIRCGIIPALAGNTGVSSNRPRHTRDHPRACGEHNCAPYHGGMGLGSSPRLRGTPSHERHFARHAGIIPALAGNTIFAWKDIPFAWDHPRACGEH